MILGVQLLGVLFALFMIYQAFVHNKRKEFTTKEYAFWILLWVCFIIVTLFPSVLNPMLGTLSLTRAMDFFTIVGFLFVLGLVFNNYIVTKKTNKKVEDLVRKIAIEESEK